MVQYFTRVFAEEMEEDVICDSGVTNSKPTQAEVLIASYSYFEFAAVRAVAIHSAGFLTSSTASGFSCRLSF